MTFTEDPIHKFEPTTDWGFKQFLKLSILKDKSSKLLSNDNLTIVCDVTLVGPKTTVAEQSTQPKLSQKVEIEDDFFEDLEAAFLSKEFSDVQLLCGDQVFDCHQFMLSARSPVFRAMFLADMAEKNEQKVDVMDIAPEVLSEMLFFISEKFVGWTNLLLISTQQQINIIWSS